MLDEYEYWCDLPIGTVIAYDASTNDLIIYIDSNIKFKVIVYYNQPGCRYDYNIKVVGTDQIEIDKENLDIERSMVVCGKEYTPYYKINSLSHYYILVFDCASDLAKFKILNEF